MITQRCGWMSEGCVSQCILASGHDGFHIWEDYPSSDEDPKQITIAEVYGEIEV